MHECKRQTCVTCVPVVVAAGPGQLRAEGKDQVEQGPGQNDDVGHTAVENDQLTSVADTCTGGHGQIPDLSQSWSHDSVSHGVLNVKLLFQIALEMFRTN